MLDYLTFVEPVATWIVTIDVDDLHVVDARPAPDASSELYGWSVVSAGDYTYLYAHCYRQFGYDPLAFAPDVPAHDYDCTADVTVARLPRGDFTARPEYWDGVEWSDDPLAAVPVIPQEGRIVNPTQVAVHDGQFVAVTKEGDWWGNTIYLDVAPAAEGPWRTYSAILVQAECERLQHLLRLDRPLRRRRRVVRHRPVVQCLGGPRLRPLQPDLHASPRTRVTTRTGPHTARRR